MTEFDQRSFDCGNSSEDIAIAHKAQVANAKDLAGQVVLAPGQGNVKPLFHHRANLLGIDC